MNKTHKTIAATTTFVAASLIFVGTTFAAYAAAPTAAHRSSSAAAHSRARPAAPVVFGRVTSISGSTITLAGRRNSETYTVDASHASVSLHHGSTTATLSLADIKVGDYIGVMGTTTGTTVTASAITGSPKGPKPHSKDHVGRGNIEKPVAIGMILSISGDSFTMSSKAPHASTTGETLVVRTSSSTVYMKDGKLDSLSDLMAGMTVAVTGTRAKDSHTISATSVHIRTQH